MTEVCVPISITAMATTTTTTTIPWFPLHLPHLMSVTMAWQPPTVLLAAPVPEAPALLIHQTDPLQNPPTIQPLHLQTGPI